MVRKIQKTYAKELQYRHHTTNQRRHNHRNRMEYKRKENTTGFSWALGAEATYQIKRSKYRFGPDKIQINKLFRRYNRYHLPERNKIKSKRDFFLTIRHGNSGGPLREIDWLRKSAFFRTLVPSYSNWNLWRPKPTKSTGPIVERNKT